MIGKNARRIAYLSANRLFLASRAEIATAQRYQTSRKGKKIGALSQHFKTILLGSLPREYNPRE
jgi:hypothetical protein